MLFSKVNDQLLRNKYNLIEKKRKINKFIFINLLSKLTLLKKKNKNFFSIYKSLYLCLFKKKNFKNKIVPHCLITYRTKKVYKKIYFSRLILRDLMQFGLVPGYKKAVW